MTNKKRAQNPYKKGSKLLNTYSHSNVTGELKTLLNQCL